MAKHRYSQDEVAAWRKKRGSFIYFNRDDSNFLVPKPFGIGRTFNWAHPLSWLVGIAVLALIIYTLYIA